MAFLEFGIWQRSSLFAVLSQAVWQVIVRMCGGYLLCTLQSSLFAVLSQAVWQVIVQVCGGYFLCILHSYVCFHLKVILAWKNPESWFSQAFVKYNLSHVWLLNVCKVSKAWKFIEWHCVITVCMHQRDLRKDSNLLCMTSFCLGVQTTFKLTYWNMLYTSKYSIHMYRLQTMEWSWLTSNCKMVHSGLILMDFKQ